MQRERERERVDERSQSLVALDKRTLGWLCVQATRFDRTHGLKEGEREKEKERKKRVCFGDASVLMTPRSNFQSLQVKVNWLGSHTK